MNSEPRQLQQDRTRSSIILQRFELRIAHVYGKLRGEVESLLKSIVDAVVPALVFFTMLIVGMELTIADFRGVARQRVTVAAALLGQLVLLPVIGWFLVRWLNLQSTIAQGVLLVVACPSGSMANVYTYVGRGNLALSVTLTAVSCLAGVLTTPLAMAALLMQYESPTWLQVPIGVVAGQLLLLLVVPILAGMSFRRRWPEVSRRHGSTLLALSIAALAALLGFVIVQEAEQFVNALFDIAAATTLLTILAFGGGWLTGWVSRVGATDRFTMGIVFVVRNVGVATAIAVTVLDRIEFAVFATAYFLAQLPILVAAALGFRSIRARILINETMAKQP